MVVGSATPSRFRPLFSDTKSLPRIPLFPFVFLAPHSLLSLSPEFVQPPVEERKQTPEDFHPYLASFFPQTGAPPGPPPPTPPPPPPQIETVTVLIPPELWAFVFPHQLPLTSGIFFRLMISEQVFRAILIVPPPHSSLPLIATLLHQ